ncbi:MAG: flagellar hook-basal body complex protein, partial [Roseicyclus sp.]|nr:flagellar hook-basal body complex protein [Roseicyclus sp.]
MTSSAMHVAMTGLNAQQSRIQVISNNLANVNTTGFRRDRAHFETLLYQEYRPAGAQTSEATQQTSALARGTGVRLVATEKIHTQGSLTTTDNALDVAIEGDGIFQV